ncbi:MAG: hypothetical protein ACREP1_10445, partial [Rhodanobacteraceae bacterium]
MLCFDKHFCPSFFVVGKGKKPKQIRLEFHHSKYAGKTCGRGEITTSLARDLPPQPFLIDGLTLDLLITQSRVK